jgi:hypothetical protein
MDRNPIDLIPHRPPVRCVDELLEYSSEHAIARATARHAWEPWLIEGLAQTAALLNAVGYADEHKGMLVQVRKFDITRAPREGEELRYRVDLVARVAPVHLMSGEVRGDGGELLARGELKFYLESDE